MESLLQDIVNKLLYLMWNDWHKEVRKVAAQSLGRTGHGKAVHDELLAKISRGAERSKLEALNKLGHLGETYQSTLVFLSGGLVAHNTCVNTTTLDHCK